MLDLVINGLKKTQSREIFSQEHIFLSVIIVALSRAGYATASDRISWARLRELTSKESSEVTQEPRILRTRATSALQVDQRSGNRDRPESCALLSFPSPVVAPYSITIDDGLRTAMAMAQSRCPLAKLKYLAFGRARIKGCTIRDSRFRFANSQSQIIARSIINARFGATHARDTRNKFRTTTKQKDRKSLARFNTPFSVAWSLIFSILGIVCYTPSTTFESLLCIQRVK